MPMLEVLKGRLSCKAKDYFTQPLATETQLVSYLDYLLRLTAIETCKHKASYNTYPNKLPESLAYSNNLLGLFSMSLGSPSLKCVLIILAADKDASACQTINKRNNRRAIASSKRKYAKKTLLSMRFQQKQDAVL